MSSQIIKSLLKLKNNSLKQNELLKLKNSPQNLLLLKFLYKEGLILTFFLQNPFVFVKLRYYYHINLLKNLKILSTPSRTLFFKRKNLYLLQEKAKTLVISTNKGLLTSLECKKNRLGGKAIFIC